MKVLIISEKKSFALPFFEAFKEKNIRVKYLRLEKINLVNKKHSTTIKPVGKELNSFDGVFLQARSSLAPFIEPMLDEFEAKNIYCNAKQGSFYACNNESFKLVSLSLCGVSTIRATITGSDKSIEALSTKITYPIVIKSIKGNAIQQSILLKKKSELDLFVKSIRSDIDSFIITEHIESDLISCIVIGDEVIAIKRKYAEDNICQLEKGANYKVTDSEKTLVLKAAKCLSLDIAQVDISEEKVVDIKSVIDYAVFDKISSDSVELKVAQFYSSKIIEHGEKSSIFSEFFGIKDIISKTIFSRFFK